MRDLNIPENKIYFSIGEAAQFFELEPHVLRRWEDEFKQLSPDTSPGGQRRYHRSDIEVLQRIDHLLNYEKFSLQGAREKLASWKQYYQTNSLAAEISDLCAETLQQINRFVEKF